MWELGCGCEAVCVGLWSVAVRSCVLVGFRCMPNWGPCCWNWRINHEISSWWRMMDVSSM